VGAGAVDDTLLRGSPGVDCTGACRVGVRVGCMTCGQRGMAHGAGMLNGEHLRTRDYLYLDSAAYVAGGRASL